MLYRRLVSFLLLFLVAPVLGCSAPITENPYSEAHQKRIAERNKHWMQNDVPSLQEVMQRDIEDPYAGLTRQDYRDQFFKATEAPIKNPDGREELNLDRLDQSLVEPENPSLPMISW